MKGEKKINSHSIHFPCHISRKRHRIYSFTSTPILPPPDIFSFFILSFLTNLQPIAPFSILFWLYHQHPNDRIFFSFRPRSLFRLDAVSIIYIQSRKGKLEMRVLDHGRSSLVVVLSPFKAQYFPPPYRRSCLLASFFLTLFASHLISRWLSFLFLSLSTLRTFISPLRTSLGFPFEN